MNVVVVTPYAPVLHLHGGGVRMFHNIRILAEKHSVRVISFVENDDERDLLKSLDRFANLLPPYSESPTSALIGSRSLPFLFGNSGPRRCIEWWMTLCAQRRPTSSSVSTCRWRNISGGGYFQS